MGSGIEAHRLVPQPGPFRRQEQASQTLPQFPVDGAVAEQLPLAIDPQGADGPAQEQGQVAFQVIRRPLFAPRFLALVTVQTGFVIFGQIGPETGAHGPQALFLGTGKARGKEIVPGQASQMGLGRLVQGPHHGKQLVTAKVRGGRQGFQPAIDFIHRPEGVVQGQLGDGTLQFLGIGQGMIGLGGKEVENHGGKTLAKGLSGSQGMGESITGNSVGMGPGPGPSPRQAPFPRGREGRG